MFYPRLRRRSVEFYYNQKGGFYSNYQEYREHITEDCQNRCVYCDVLLEEVGGEGMQLDHFRPQSYFGHLGSHPYNLILSCAKCNRLKSNDWPADKVDGAPSHLNGIGYIDPFSEDLKNYVSICDEGRISHIRAPLAYVIERLRLNRESRVQIRRRRIIRRKAKDLADAITERLENLVAELNSGAVSKSDMRMKVSEILEVQKLLCELLA